jgi:hypothetical protein
LYTRLNRTMNKLWIVPLTALLLTAPSIGQNARQAASRPAPRWPDGHVNLGPPPGEKGHWIRQGRAQLASNPESVIAAGPGGLPTNLKLEDVPFQPWARALYEYRQRNFERDAPHSRCKPSPGPRQVGTAYGFEIVEMPELKRVFIFDIGGPHSFRIIYMDERSHPKNPEPTYIGHSTGHWDGDALVVDTVGFNEGSWIETEGFPHTDQLHLIERFTRTNFNTLKYEVTVDDPAAYTKPWTGGFNLRWDSGAEMFEYVCQENNKVEEVTAGADGSERRTSLIVP